VIGSTNFCFKHFLFPKTPSPSVNKDFDFMQHRLRSIHPFNSRFRRIIALCATLIFSCLAPEDGTEIPNELTGTEFLAGSGVASDAEIQLVPVGFQPGGTSRSDSVASAVFKTTTGVNGKFTFRDVPAGLYNIVASKNGSASFRDSVAVTGKRQSLEADTLRTPGRLVGLVALQPQHDPRTAIVQVMGTLLFVNVEKDGKFNLEGLGAGSYRLRVTTSLAGYSPLFKEVSVRSGMEDTLPEPLRPFYFEIPVVTGLTAKPGSEGTVILRWSVSDFDKVRSYCIYRDTVRALLPSTAPIQCVTDTIYIDTIYSPTPRHGQYPYQDTVHHSFVYRVKILSQSDDVGPSFGFAEVRAVPPSIGISLGQWNQAIASAPFGSRIGHTLLTFKDRLWLLGGGAQDSFDIWSSSDGIEWRQELIRAPFPSPFFTAVVFQEKIWVLGTFELPNPNSSVDPHIRNFLWNSENGVEWTQVADSIPVLGRRHPTFAATSDRLFILAGERISPWTLEEAWISDDGLAWTQAVTPVYATRSAATAFQGRLWLLAGGSTLMGNHQIHNRSTLDGSLWQEESTAIGMLPRMDPVAAEHQGDLWMLGGVSVDSLFNHTQRRDSWKSANGRDWTRVDALTPFTARTGARLISYQGKLWLVGGQLAENSLVFTNDVWYLE
jgi:hypothetical protein